MKIIEVGAMALIQTNHKEHYKKELTLESTGMNGKTFSLELYINHPDKRLLYVPRGICSPELIIKHLSKEWGKVDISFGNFELKDLQKTLVSRWLGNGNAIIKAPTGAGKTVMGIYIASVLGYKTLVIVPTDTIMTQWVDRFVQFTNCERNDIGIIRQNICEYRDRKVVVGMIHTLSKADGRFPKELYSEFGTVIIDENHVLGAETFSRVAGLFNSKHRLGLSATPRRKDGMENVFNYHIGNIISEDIGLPVTPRVVIVEYYNLKSHHRGCVWGGKLSIGSYIRKVSLIPERTRRICDYVLKAFSKGHRVLVLTDRLNHIEAMKIILSKSIHPKDLGIITAETKQADRKVILATYGSAGMGLDIPELTCLVIATPRVDIEQAVGRILREADKIQPVIIDFVDCSSTIMKAWGAVRRKFYKKHCMEIKIVKEDYV